MININKHYVIDESNKLIAVQIPIDEFKIMEEILEHYGLGKLIDDYKNGKSLSLKDGQEYYRNSK